jgi:DNA (cytosine-5)-methyltransferase 1
MKFVYYNEYDKDKAAWLRELVKAGLIAPGDVDDRSIADINASDLMGYTQCHFFAGIGVWSYALRLAGWGDDRQVWTGSCPCPSFSVAGKGGGFTDPRHLWPIWFNLIRECHPGTVFGEQTDGAIGHGWLDLVSGDMEAESYAFAAAVLGAHSAGAPHIRQRLYFCSIPMHAQRGPLNEHGEDGCDRQDTGRKEARGLTGTRGEVCNGNDAKREGLERQFGNVREWRGPGWLDPITARSVAETGATSGFWSDCDWWYGRDGKHRPIGPGVQPLAHGVAARVVKLRGYGDAICSETAAHFIASAMEAIG